MNDSLRRTYTFFLVNYFIQGCIGIVYEPLDYLLKDHLKLTPGQASGFIAWMTLPLLFKPLYGYVTDFLPIGAYRRKPHLFLGAFAASLAFFWMAARTHSGYFGLLWPMTLSCFALAFADAVCGGLLVEDGKERHQTGPYQALHIGALYLSAILCGAGSGWMTSHIPFPWIFAFAGFLPLIICASAFLIQEPRVVIPAKVGIQNNLDGLGPGFRRGDGALWRFLRTKQFWALGLTIVLWNFYPFLGTVQFYYQSNVLHLNPQWIGSLMSVGSVAGLIGSAVFWKFCRKDDSVSSPESRVSGQTKETMRDAGRETWMSWGPVGMTLVSLSYLFYFDAISVTVVEALFGFASVFFRLALLDLIARTCPADAEATSYALFLTFFDVAMYGSNALGGKLYDVLQRMLAMQMHHDQISAMVLILIGAACTLSCRWTLRFSRTTMSCS